MIIKIDSIYQVKIEVEDRGEFGKYGIVYARCLLDWEWKNFKRIGTLPPEVKLSKKLFYAMLEEYAHSM